MRPARIRQKEKQNQAIYLVDNKSTARSVRVKGKPLRWVKLILAGLGLYLLFLFGMSGFEIWKLKQQITNLEQEQSQLVQHQEQIKQELQSLNNPEVIEKIARENLGMVRNGETIVIPAVPGYDIPKPKSIAPGEIAH